ncbi:hypothetical protein FH508_0003975 [Lysinibacillus sp. CD3-6]|uniref:hypothetical protein n=1 Tax=Lysinibacillus sp. CD3-6 TaxID=2892541 RepID=UPI001168CB39|nr:hypothetical protein [Lysinibacillus sp. CD3-6]UED81057.1 hypothetical protein FH508_0003975 [Lysinibacillus sp. CD3-6]
MNTDIQFLKELQAQMKWEDEHDYDSQASPRFWTVMDYKKEPCWDEHAEYWVIYSPSNCEDYSMEEETIKDLIDNHDLKGDAAEILEDFSIMDDDDVLEWFQKFIDGDAYLVPQREVSFIAPNTMFLTKEEAKRHIELNHYHYSKKAHTYAMTAWRAPKVAQLINILMSFDWESVQVKKGVTNG